MWHEARKQEKKIRGLMNDFYKRRSERRKQFYDIAKTDPMRFLQLHGSKYKIHYEGDMEKSQMMKWGDTDILIDRFDVRAHLDPSSLPTTVKNEEDEVVDKEKSELYYESYRVIIQNDFLGLNEEQFLHQLSLEEQFGVSAHQSEEKSKKKNSQCGATIGFNYGNSDNSSVTTSNVPFSQQILSIETTKENRYDEYAKELSDDSDADVDGVVDLKKLNEKDTDELNSHGKRYGLMPEDFNKFLKRDEEQRQISKQMKDQDTEKTTTGKKFRRDRKMNREKRNFIKPLSPPSYAAVEESKTEKPTESDQSSDGDESPTTEKITFITSFGGDDEDQTKKDAQNKAKFSGNSSKSFHSRSHSYADVVKENSNKLKRVNYSERYRNMRRSSSSSNERVRNERSRSRDRRRSPDMRDRYRRYRRSRSRSYSHSRSRSRSRRRSRSPRRDRSRSRSRSRKTSSNYRRDERYQRKSPAKSRHNYRDTSRNRSPNYSADRRNRNNGPRNEPSTSSYHKEATSSKQKSEKLEIPTSVDHSIEVNLLSNQEVPIKRYYGRRKSNESNSSLSADDSDEDRGKKLESSINDNNTNSKTADTKNKDASNSTAAMTQREKLKKKMQLLLNKQFKADKKAETERKVREKQQQQEREEEMRELSLKLRKKQREKRHVYHGIRRSSSTDTSTEYSTSNRKRKSSSSSSSSTSSDDGRYSRR